MTYPGMLNTGAPSKYSENFSASSVALEMISFKSGLNLAISFTNPNNIWVMVKVFSKSKNNNKNNNTAKLPLATKHAS